MNTRPSRAIRGGKPMQLPLPFDDIPALDALSTTLQSVGARSSRDALHRTLRKARKLLRIVVAGSR